MTRARSLSRLANSNAFTVDGSNNVGIGSTQPDARLDVDGDMNVSGTLTYEDVTNVETAGITTTGGLIVTGLGATIGGITTFFGDINFGAAGVGGTVTTLGHAEFAGVVTATSFSGDGSALTGVASTENINTSTLAQFTGPVGIADSIFHIGDSDTAIRFPSADTFAVKVNGSDRFHVTSGNVGINESSPGQRLTVGGDAQIGFNSPTDAGRQLIFNANRGSAGDTIANLNWQWNSTNVAQIRGIAGADTSNKDDAHLAFFTAPAGSLLERLRVTSGGNIGINSTDPTSYANSQATLLIEDTISPALCISDTGQARDWFLIGQGDGLAINYADGGGSGSASNVTGSMFLRNNGNIGINESTPGAKLHIVDTMQATANGHNQLLILGDDSGTDGESASIYMSAINATNRGCKILSERQSSSNDHDLIFQTSPVSDVPAERLRIDSSGNVNIGPSAAPRKRLDITGPDGRSGASPGNSDTALIIDNDAGNGAIMEFLSDNNAFGRIFFTDTDASNRGQIVYEHSSDAFQFSTAGSERLRITSAGHVRPGSDNSQDLGSSSLRWANIYSADLQLSNEGSSNDVDGTWGQYTIQEGENDLFLLNRRNGKKYKFVLEEVN